VSRKISLDSVYRTVSRVCWMPNPLLLESICCSQPSLRLLETRCRFEPNQRLARRRPPGTLPPSPRPLFSPWGSLSGQNPLGPSLCSVRSRQNPHAGSGYPAMATWQHRGNFLATLWQHRRWRGYFVRNPAGTRPLSSKNSTLFQDGLAPIIGSAHVVILADLGRHDVRSQASHAVPLRDSKSSSALYF
jgi:hypothetical protein